MAFRKFLIEYFPRNVLSASGNKIGLYVVWVLTAFFGSLLVQSTSMAMDYRVQAGDSLDFSVIGIPELKQRINISLEGAASFPLIGEINVAGLNVGQIRDLVRSKIPDKTLNIRSNDGREVTTVISASEVSIDIGEYRPIYIVGDVSKPGEQTYKPGITVRKAVAVAGGYDLLRYRSINPIMESADYQSEHDSLLIEATKLAYGKLRLEAELAGKTNLPQQNEKDVVLKLPLSKQIHAAEEAVLKSRMEAYVKERSMLKNFIDNAATRVGVLEEQLKREEEGAKLDASEIDRIEDLNKRGVVPITRAVESRRVALLSSTRALQVNAQLGQSRKERDEATKNLTMFEDKRRNDILSELQENFIRTLTLKSRQQAVGEKLMYTGVLKSQLVRGTGTPPEISVFRSNPDGTSDRFVATADTILSPGDTVEISLSSDYNPSKK